MLFKCSRNPGGSVPLAVANQWPVMSSEVSASATWILPKQCGKAPNHGWAPFDSASVMTRRKAIDGCVDAFEARL